MNLTTPAMNYEKMDYNHLTLLCGMNGTGKSLILKFTWGLSLLGNCYLVGKAHSVPFDARKEAQFIIDTCFDEPDFTGKVETYHENGTIRIVLQGGIVNNVELDIDEDVDPQSPIVYMSGATRKFDDIVQYMKVKNMTGVKATMASMDQDSLMKLCSMYKLYDVMFCEQALIKFNGYVFTEELKKTLTETLTLIPDLKSLEVDFDKPDILCVDTHGFKSSITKLSAGEQSYINMMINSG